MKGPIKEIITEIRRIFGHCNTNFFHEWKFIKSDNVLQYYRCQKCGVLGSKIVSHY